MNYDPQKHHRRSIRLLGYDYSRSGAYFITLCVENRECLFGDVVNGEMRLNETGRIAAACWKWLAEQYTYVELDEWVVMPNHLHGIIVIRSESGDTGRGASRRTPTNGPSISAKIKPLGQLIGAFKIVSTPRINALRGMPGVSVWQRNYYEHIIRDPDSMNRIRRYIANNPGKWKSDLQNPNNESD